MLKNTIDTTTMDVFVDSLGSPSFSIEVGLWDTVLSIKQKIEKSKGFPVSRQILFFKSKVLQDHLDITQYDIIQNSRLKLFFSPDPNPNPNINFQVPQTEPPSSSSSSSAPLNPIEEFDKATQSWPLNVGRNNDQTEETQVSLNEFRGIQESPVTVEGKNEYQVLHQTEQSLIVSDSVGGDSSVMVRSTNYNESQTLREIERLLDLEDNLAPVVNVGSSSNTDQVVGTLVIDKGKEIIEIPDSPVKKKMKTNPMKMVVMVMPFKENWSFPVEVNEDDKVEELRKELVNMKERGLINLPQEEEGFFFMLNQDSLVEDQSFRWNNVASGDTIMIYRGFIT